jgi:hypothetical protein
MHCPGMCLLVMHLDVAVYCTIACAVPIQKNVCIQELYAAPGSVCIQELCAAAVGVLLCCT